MEVRRVERNEERDRKMGTDRKRGLTRCNSI